MLDIILIVIVCIIGGIFLIGPIFMNTAGPFIIWKTQRLPAVVEFEPLDDELFIIGRNVQFKRYDIEVHNLGFKVVGSSMLHDGDEVNYTKTYVRLYWNQALRVAALVATIKSNIEENTYLEYTQEYCDGTVLDVMNSPVPGVFPDIEFKKGFRYPKIKNAKALLSIHTTLKNGLRRDIEVVDFDVATGFADMISYMKKESDVLCKKGFLKPEIDENGKRGLTFFGAVQITYKAINPLKSVFSYFTEMKDNKILKKYTDQENSD